MIALLHTCICTFSMYISYCTTLHVHIPVVGFFCITVVSTYCTYAYLAIKSLTVGYRTTKIMIEIKPV